MLGRQLGALIGRARSQKSEHPPLPGLRHQPSPEDDQIDAVALRQRLGCHQGRELTQRMAGHHVLERPAHLRPPGQAGTEDGRLSERGALLHPVERVLAHRVADHVKQVWPHALDRLAHVRRLAALTGEENCR